MQVPAASLHGDELRTGGAAVSPAVVAHPPFASTTDAAGDDAAADLGGLPVETPQMTQGLSAVPDQTEGRTWVAALSPDNRYRISAGTDGGLQLDDLQTARILDLTRYRISSVAFSPDSRQLAGAGLDCIVYLFDCESGERSPWLGGMSAAVRSVAFSPGGHLLAAADREGLVKIWNTVSLSEIQVVPVATAAVHCIRFAPDGHLLAIASGDWRSAAGGAVLLWDLEISRLRFQFEGLPPIGALAFADQSTLHAADWSGRVLTWQLDGDNRSTSFVDKDLVSIAAFSVTNGVALVNAVASGGETDDAP